MRVERATLGRRVRSGVALAAMIAASVVACGSKHDSTPSAPPLAACTPREPPGPKGTYASAALPTGACPAEAAPCQLDVYDACLCTTATTSTRVVCTCSDGTWSCLTYSESCGCDGG